MKEPLDNRLFGLFHNDVKELFANYILFLLIVLAAACPQFAQREFSFTLENDVYRRYLSFSNHIEFEKELIKMCPEKIDIGAVYSAKVRFKNYKRFLY